MTALYVLLGILIFGILIAIHEFGHFLAARAFGVKVEEFSIGMGPAVWKKQKGETLFALRCIPIGGYCLMTGEDGESEEPRAFVNQKIWKRLIILCAGAFMNFLLGLLIVLILYANSAAFLEPIIYDFFPGCPYESEDCFQKGDRFIRIDGKRIYSYYEVSERLAAGDGTYDIVIKRDGKRIKYDNLKIEKMAYDGYDGKMYGFYLGYEEATPLVRLRATWETCMDFSRRVWQGLKMLVSGEAGVQDMSGPVGIVDYMAETGANAETVGEGLDDIFFLAAFIAVNLAIMNMLPIPSLDGGRVFLLLITAVIEAVTRKKLDAKYEAYINSAGMILMLMLMAFIMLNDIYKLIG